MTPDDATITPERLEKIARRIRENNALIGGLINAQPLIGGAAAQVYLLEFQDTQDATTHKYLLRAHGEIDRMRNPNIARDEFALLKTLHNGGLPVPQPRYLEPSGDVLSIPFLVVDYIEGKTVFDPPDTADFLRQSVETLVKIHQFEGFKPSLDFLGNRAEHAQWWIEFQPETLDETLDEGRLRALLRDYFPLKQVNASCLLHGDFWAGNLIWRDGRLVGVIDWEDAETGDPLADLAVSRLEMLWAFGQDAMHTFTDLYKAQMPHLDYANLPYWDLFAALRPCGQLANWSENWPKLGRADVTEQTMIAAHRWLVAQALKAT